MWQFTNRDCANASPSIRRWVPNRRSSRSPPPRKHLSWWFWRYESPPFSRTGNVFTVTFQSVDADIAAEHEGINAAMQFQILIFKFRQRQNTSSASFISTFSISISCISRNILGHQCVYSSFSDGRSTIAERPPTSKKQRSITKPCTCQKDNSPRTGNNNGFDVAAFLDGRLLRHGWLHFPNAISHVIRNRGLSPGILHFWYYFHTFLILIIIHIRLITAQKYEAPFMTTLLQGSICFVPVKFI